MNSASLHIVSSKNNVSCGELAETTKFEFFWGKYERRVTQYKILGMINKFGIRNPSSLPPSD